jgi:hypothetical protein
VAEVFEGLIQRDYEEQEKAMSGTPRTTAT